MFYFVLFSSLTFIYNINSFTFYLYIVYFSIHFTIFFILLANLLFFIYNGINKIKGVNHMKKKKLKEFVILSLIFILIMLGTKTSTLMPTDCSVLCTPTILPTIRISWDCHPTFMLISGAGPKVFRPLMNKFIWA